MASSGEVPTVDHHRATLQRITAPAPPPTSAAPSAPAARQPAAPIQQPAAPIQRPAARQAVESGLSGAPNSTFATALAKGPMGVDQAVARVALICEAVDVQRASGHGQLSPWHIGFDGADGSGRPTILPPDAYTDPMRVGLYTPPELGHEEPGATAEVYSLGCILFEAIAGRPPYTGKTPEELARRHAKAAVPAVRMVRRECELPPSLEVEIQHALRKRPGDRHPTPALFARAIRAAIREDDRATMAFNLNDPEVAKELAARMAAAEAAKAGPSAAAAAPAAAPAQPAAAPPAKRNNAVLAVALVAILGLGGGLAWVLMQDDPAPAPAMAPPVPVPAPEPVADVAPAAPDVQEGPDSEDALDADDTEDAEAEVLEEEPQPGRGRPRVRVKTPDPVPEKVVEPPKKRDGGPAVF